MACSCLNFSIQKTHQTAKNDDFCKELLSENDFEAVLVNFCCYEYVSEAVQKRRLAQGYCWSYTNSLETTNFIATPMKKII